MDWNKKGRAEDKAPLGHYLPNTKAHRNDWVPGQGTRGKGKMCLSGNMTTSTRTRETGRLFEKEKKEREKGVTPLSKERVDRGVHHAELSEGSPPGGERYPGWPWAALVAELSTSGGSEPALLGPGSIARGKTKKELEVSDPG